MEVTGFEQKVFFEGGVVYRSSLPTERIPSPPYVFKNGIQIFGPVIEALNNRNNPINHPNQELLSIENISRPRSKSVSDIDVNTAQAFEPPSTRSAGTTLRIIPVPERQPEPENKEAATMRKKSF